MAPAVCACMRPAQLSAGAHPPSTEESVCGAQGPRQVSEWAPRRRSTDVRYGPPGGQADRLQYGAAAAPAHHTTRRRGPRCTPGPTPRPSCHVAGRMDYAAAGGQGGTAGPAGSRYRHEAAGHPSQRRRQAGSLRILHTPMTCPLPPPARPIPPSSPNQRKCLLKRYRPSPPPPPHPLPCCQCCQRRRSGSAAAYRIMSSLLLSVCHTKSKFLFAIRYPTPHTPLTAEG